MRPAILNPLFAEARTLPGVGAKTEKLIARAVGRNEGARVLDLVFHLPSGLIDRRYQPKLNAAQPARVATVTVNVISHHPPPRGRRLPYKVICTDESGAMEVVFFNAHEDHIRRSLPVGAKRILSGRIDVYGGRIQMPHPDFIAAVEEPGAVPAIEPVYRTTEALPARTLMRATQRALLRLPELPEWLDRALVTRERWPDFTAALRASHAPQTDGDLLPASVSRTRLAYDELVANQLALALVRQRLRARPGRSLKGSGRLRNKALAGFPYRLTDSQAKAIAEIEADMAKPERMLRLLQGDVGSGKTVVAMMALLIAVEAGSQGALMAPTEILARQHKAALQPLADSAGVQLALLTGRERGPAREATLEALEKGEIDILVGTHALFSEDVRFRDLALAVVDEQHRFGVHQRMKLQGKGDKPADVLVMTATPIPRTLQLTAYGDMDVSRLTGLLPGRKPVAPRVLSDERLDEVVDALRRALAKGARAYWVCPLVEESAKVDLAAAVERAAMLKKVFGAKVGLVHGDMKGTERDAAMECFRKGDTVILVATTVIEVGVDVPEATIMVVEHAERFGLAQLHQLRGRVGRGPERSTCLLIYQPPLTETAKARLAVLRRTNDGFVIAEEDLRLRGAGELLGVRQSGLPDFRFADLVAYAGLLATARDDARLALQKDPELRSPRGEDLRILLYLFERDEAVRFLKAG
ncbi:MAG: ATP-dependent DNA helicase RecG [Alphaproteobacteria bacterium]